MTPRVFVTGLGLVTPLGCDREAVWESLCAGRSGVATPRRYAAERPPTRALGEVAPEDLERLREELGPSAGPADERTVFAVAAARRALTHAGMPPGPHARGGACVASGPGAHRIEDGARFSGPDGRLDPAAAARDPSRVHDGSLWRSPVDRPAAEIARREGLGGPVGAVTTASSASLQAVGSALRDLRAGRADWMLAGGADSMVDPMGLVFFVLLGAAATEEGPAACRPFSRRRTGMVTGEGAGVLVLETEAHARARGARPLAELAGYGSSFDAHRVVAPHPQGRGTAEAMRRALSDARLDAAEVDLVVAHATGTRLNDPAEARAIRGVFGERTSEVAVTSTKSMLGHLFAAAGAVSLASAVLSVDRGVIPPTINLDDPDPACALDHVAPAARRRRVRAALVNGLAFGGHNATIAVRAAAEGPLP